LSDYLLSVILGIIEGLTEFLPVSSTAHLRIGEALLHIDLASGYWKMYTIVIQLGAILCLPVYFRERIAKLLSTFPQGERGDRTILTHSSDKNDRETSGKPGHHGKRAGHRRDCDVAGGREKR
jgi:undecaprenyl-diphosphatase